MINDACPCICESPRSSKPLHSRTMVIDYIMSISCYLPDFEIQHEYGITRLRRRLVSEGEFIEIVLLVVAYKAK